MKIEVDGFKQLFYDCSNSYELEHKTVSIEELGNDKVKFSSYHHEIGSENIIIDKSDLRKILRIFE